MSTSAAPVPAPHTAEGASKPQAPRPPSRYQQNLKKYGNPLPLRLLDAPLEGPAPSPSYLTSITPSFLRHRRIDVPSCTGTYDALTRSVWVTKRDDMEMLFCRGFFGKGTLSRSEATWKDRRVDMVKGGNCEHKKHLGRYRADSIAVLAEQIRAKRRLDRKQFKVDRAAAMLDAAKAAEAILTQGQTPGEESAEQADGSQASGIDVTTLTAQTFLVRPTRPDANRNRGRKPFKRRPPVPAGQAGAVDSSAKPQPRVYVPPPAPVEEDDDDGSEEDPFDEDLVPEMEHLQLGLEEAWFLAAGLGVLKILDPQTVSSCQAVVSEKQLTV